MCRSKATEAFAMKQKVGACKRAHLLCLDEPIKKAGWSQAKSKLLPPEGGSFEFGCKPTKDHHLF